MRYLMALMLVWGVCQFSSAQVEQNLDKDCPPTSKNEGQTEDNGVDMDVNKDADANVDADVNLENDGYVRENEVEIESDDADAKIEEDLNSEGKTDIRIETDGNTDIKIESDESDAADLEMQPADSMPMQQDQSKECPEVDSVGTTSDASLNTTTYETSNVVVTEEDKERSTAGKILVAPVKFVGNIPKAVFSVGSETLEGAGHIVGAPFKGIGKLFGAGDDDDEQDI